MSGRGRRGVARERACNAGAAAGGGLGAGGPWEALGPGTLALAPGSRCCSISRRYNTLQQLRLRSSQRAVVLWCGVVLARTEARAKTDSTVAVVTASVSTAGRPASTSSIRSGLQHTPAVASPGEQPRQLRQPPHVQQETPGMPPPTRTCAAHACHPHARVQRKQLVTCTSTHFVTVHGTRRPPSLTALSFPLVELCPHTPPPPSRAPWPPLCPTVHDCAPHDATHMSMFRLNKREQITIRPQTPGRAPTAA